MFEEFFTTFYRNRNHDGTVNQKKSILKTNKGFGVVTKFIMKNYGKTMKIRHDLRKLDFGSRSGLGVGKVLAPYNARSKMVPIIKYAKWM